MGLVRSMSIVEIEVVGIYYCMLEIASHDLADDQLQRLSCNPYTLVACVTVPAVPIAVQATARRSLW